MTLTKKQIEAFAQQLREMRTTLTQHLVGAQAEVKMPEEGKGYSQHQADEGTDDFDRTINIQLTSEEEGVLRRIERALEKVDEGTYGVCDVTGEPIPLNRLQAIPYANMTRDAQERFEKGQI